MMGPVFPDPGRAGHLFHAVGKIGAAKVFTRRETGGGAIPFPSECSSTRSIAKSVAYKGVYRFYRESLTNLEEGYYFPQVVKASAPVTDPDVKGISGH